MNNSTAAQDARHKLNAFAGLVAAGVSVDTAHKVADAITPATAENLALELFEARVRAKRAAIFGGANRPRRSLAEIDAEAEAVRHETAADLARIRKQATR